jgi:hypothetical protein
MQVIWIKWNKQNIETIGGSTKEETLQNEKKKQYKMMTDRAGIHHKEKL